MPQGDQCWKVWAENVRKELMTKDLVEIQKTVAEIQSETGTDEPLSNLMKPGFWNACQRGIKDWDTIPKQGLEIDYRTNPQGEVELVTLRLNETWRGARQRAAERRGNS